MRRAQGDQTALPAAFTDLDQVPGDEAAEAVADHVDLLGARRGTDGLALREPRGRCRLRRRVRVTCREEAQRLEQSLDRDVAPLDRLGRDGLEQPSQAPVVYGGGNANTLGAELLEEHLLR